MVCSTYLFKRQEENQKKKIFYLQIKKKISLQGPRAFKPPLRTCHIPHTTFSTNHQTPRPLPLFSYIFPAPSSSYFQSLPYFPPPPRFRSLLHVQILFILRLSGCLVVWSSKIPLFLHRPAPSPLPPHTSRNVSHTLGGSESRTHQCSERDCVRPHVHFLSGLPFGARRGIADWFSRPAFGHGKLWILSRELGWIFTSNSQSSNDLGGARSPPPLLCECFTWLTHKKAVSPHTWLGLHAMQTK